MFGLRRRRGIEDRLLGCDGIAAQETAYWAATVSRHRGTIRVYGISLRHRAVLRCTARRVRVW